MFSRLKYHIRQYFGYSRSQTNGVVVLLLCISTALVVPLAIRYYDIQKQKVACRQDSAKLNTLIASLEKKKEHASSKPFSKQPIASKNFFDINTADETRLQQLYEIGPVRAVRIIDYRNRLGGFVDPAQYSEIYNLPDSLVARLQKHTLIKEDFLPQQHNLNTSTVEVLANHPYLSYSQAQTIVAYRTQHGAFSHVQDLEKLVCIPPPTLKKLYPYLRVTS